MTRLRLVIALTILTGINISVAQQNQIATSTAKTMTSEQLNIRYAEIYLDLAKLQLQRTIDANKQVPGTFTNSSIASMRQVLFVAQEQLKALQQSNGKSANSYLISAEINAQAAVNSYAQTKTLSETRPGVIAPAELERLRLTAELANINLQKAKSIGASSSHEYVQWQLDQLREDYFQISNQVSQVSRIN